MDADVLQRSRALSSWFERQAVLGCFRSSSSDQGASHDPREEVQQSLSWTILLYLDFED